MVLERICEGVWSVQSELRLGAGFWLPTRMTVLRRGGGLVLHSPVALDDATAAAVEALGPVEALVAPSLLHHLFVGQARARWPGARLLGPPGLATKRPDLRVDGVLGPGSLGPEIGCLPISGAPSVNEVLLLHRASRTLVVTDLVFNIRRPRGWLTPWVLRAVGAHRRVGQSRAWRLLLVRDRAAFAASGRALLAEEFDRIVVAHGEVIEPQARGEFVEALAWMLGGAPGLPA